MASWLKAAEDLFEVVDRRAKLVVEDKPDELPVPAKEGSNGRGSQTKRARARGKKKHLTHEAPSATDNKREQTIPETLELRAQLCGNILPLSVENSVSNPGIGNIRVDISVHKADTDGSVTETSVLGTTDNETNPVGDHVDAEMRTDVEAIDLNLNGESRAEEFGDIPVENQSNAPLDVKVVNGDPSVVLNQNVMSEDAGTFKNIGLSGSQIVREDTPTKADSQSKDLDSINEPEARIC